MASSDLRFAPSSPIGQSVNSVAARGQRGDTRSQYRAWTMYQVCASPAMELTRMPEPTLRSQITDLAASLRQQQRAFAA